MERIAWKTRMFVQQMVIGIVAEKIKQLSLVSYRLYTEKSKALLNEYELFWCLDENIHDGQIQCKNHLISRPGMMGG